MRLNCFYIRPLRATLRAGTRSGYKKVPGFPQL